MGLKTKDKADPLIGFTTPDSVSIPELPSQFEAPSKSDLPKELANVRETTLLWEYKNLGSLDRIPVCEEDRGIIFKNEDLLQSSFYLHRVPRVWTGWVSPDNAKFMAEYEVILKEAGERKIEIISENKQYDPAKGAFIVLIRYDQIVYKLHERYKFMKEDKEQT